MKSKSFWLIGLLIVLYSCSTPVAQTWTSLLRLEGRWTGNGTLQINQSWKRTGDSILEGRTYQLINTDTMVLEEYHLFVQQGKLFCDLLDNDGNLELTRSGRNHQFFELNDRNYPQHILLEWYNDTLLTMIKENSRGNQQLVFELVKTRESR